MRLPTARPIGPAPRPDSASWDKAEKILNSAFHKAKASLSEGCPFEAVRQAQDHAYALIAKAAEMELMGNLQVAFHDEDLANRLKTASTRRGKGLRLRKVPLTFKELSQGGPRRPQLQHNKWTRWLLTRTHLMQGHARQAIRTQMPRIDNQTVAELTEDLEQRLGNLQDTSTGDIPWGQEGFVQRLARHWPMLVPMSG